MHERLAKVEKLTLQEQIYDQLKTGLMRGQFSPGDVLVTRKLAEEMGTSVMPVRDALHRLAAERALVLLPNRSVAVPTTTREPKRCTSRPAPSAMRPTNTSQAGNSEP